MGRRMFDGSVGLAVLADDGDRRMPAGCRFGELHRDVGDVAHVGENPDLGLAGLAADDWLELPVHRELHVALFVWQRGIGRHVQVGPPSRRREAHQVARDVLERAAAVVDGERAGIPDGRVPRALPGLGEVGGCQRRTIGAFGQLAFRRRHDGADELRPVGVVELAASAGTVEDVVVLQHHVADRNPLLGDDRQAAVETADREQADHAEIDVRRRQHVQVAVIPVGALRVRLRDVVGVCVRSPRRHVQHHVVGVALGAHVQAVRVQVERRFSELLRIERHRLVLGDIGRTVEVADREAAQPVLEMHDQFFAREDL